MAVDDAGNERLHLASRVAGLLISLPVTIALTALGAVAMATRELGRLVSSLWPRPDPPAPAPRHHAARVRERAAAAMQAARDSGLLSKRDR